MDDDPLSDDTDTDEYDDAPALSRRGAWHGLAGAGDWRRALTGTVAVVALAAVGIIVVGGSPPPAELSIPVVGSPGDPSATAASASARARGEDDGSNADDDEVVVHAAGAVVRPGLYRLARGARVADLLDAAGGPLPDADVDQLNLAARLEDGTRVRVPRRGELAAPDDAGISPPAAGTPAIVDLNSATVAQLDELPGVGPATAQAIVDWRIEHGRFRAVEQLLEVRGIGEAKLSQLRARVRV